MLHDTQHLVSDELHPSEIDDIEYLSLQKKMTPIRFGIRIIFYFTLFSFFNIFISFGLTAQQTELKKKTKVKNINFEMKNENETVTIELDQFVIPTIFDLNGKRPRLVIDIMDILPWKGQYKTPVNGRIINQIRAYFHRESKKIRIVLDLNSSIDCGAVIEFDLTGKIVILLKPIKKGHGK